MTDEKKAFGGEDVAGRAERVARYQRVMGLVIADKVMEARRQLVRMYRANPGVFPSGPDGRVWGCEAWYRPEQWNDQGDFLATKES